MIIIITLTKFVSTITTVGKILTQEGETR